MAPPSISLENDSLLLGGFRPAYDSQSTRIQNFKSISAERKSISRVSYSPGNHVQVLFQMYGSALPQVLPFCLANVIWTMTVSGLKSWDMIDITFKSSTAHTFMGLLVSFLVVERSRVSYNRFMENRCFLADCYRCCREIIQLGCAYTYMTKTEAAREWRQNLAYRTILLLRVTMDTLEWSSTHRDRWEIKHDTAYKKEESPHIKALRELTHGDRTLVDENFRATLMFEYALRETIMSHPEFLGYKLHANEYRDLVLVVSQFNKAFHGFRVLVFTPYPFPLVQMTRTFLFFWVYSLPLVLVDQMGSLYSTLLMVFFLTFGFVGIEYVSMTLDDPYGHDVNDVDHNGMAELVFEDVYLTLYKVDGLESAREVKRRVMDRIALGRGLDCYHHDFRSDEFWGRTSPTGSLSTQRSGSMGSISEEMV
jgi:predicted membrane chloride channel (bestrophin family)